MHCNTKDGERLGVPLANDALLCVGNVAFLMGCAPNTARRIMRESGVSFRIHRRLYIYESDLHKYLHGQAGNVE